MIRRDTRTHRRCVRRVVGIPPGAFHHTANLPLVRQPFQLLITIEGTQLEVRGLLEAVVQSGSLH